MIDLAASALSALAVLAAQAGDVVSALQPDAAVPLGAVVAVALTFGYLLGSIPFGLVLTRTAGLGDIRNVGSGNIGATNVLRTGNKKLAAATLVGDMLKGTVAVLVGSRLPGGAEAALVASMVHYGDYTVGDIKRAMAAAGVAVRPPPEG